MGFTLVFVAFMSIQPMVVFVECMGANPMNVHKPIESRFFVEKLDQKPIDENSTTTKLHHIGSSLLFWRKILL